MSAQNSQNLPETSHFVPFGDDLKNAGVHETLNLPAGAQGHYWQFRGGWFLRHHHDEIELNLITSGRAFYLVGEQKIPLARGTLLWLFPDQGHILLERSADFEMKVVVWRPELVQMFARRELRAFFENRGGAVRVRRLAPPVLAHLETIGAQFEAAKSQDARNAILAYFLVSAHEAFEGADEAGAGRESVHPCVEKAARILQNRALDLPQLAREVGLSRARLSELFKAQIGVSITQFRAQKQVERFLRLYEGGALGIGEAAREAGFGSYAQFHRVFSQTMGVSPAMYRAKTRASGDF